MKFRIFSFSMISAALLGNVAGARSIQTDLWGDQQQPTFTGAGEFFPPPALLPVSGTFSGTSASVNPQNVPTDYGTASLTGVSNLSFSPGNTFSNYLVALAPIEENAQGWVEYAWGNGRDAVNPSEQIVLIPGAASTVTSGPSGGPTSEFLLNFNYASPLDPQTGSSGQQGLTGQAWVTVNNITYTHADPGAILEGGLGDPSFTRETPDVLVFVNGLLQNAAYYLANGWTETKSGSGGGVMGAPEIDPASAVASLTLLAGGVAIMLSRSRRREAAQQSTAR